MFSSKRRVICLPVFVHSCVAHIPKLRAAPGSDLQLSGSRAVSKDVLGHPGRIAILRAGAMDYEASGKSDRTCPLQSDDTPQGRPGVIAHSTVLVEHPVPVCDRILRFANVVGRERAIAGARLEALVKGAQMASDRLWAS
jgi:hypothetical protein